MKLRGIVYKMNSTEMNLIIIKKYSSTNHVHADILRTAESKTPLTHRINNEISNELNLNKNLK